MKNRQHMVILVLLILITLFVRLYRWDSFFAFNAEYNYKLWPMLKIIVDHKIPLIGIEAVSYLHHIHYPPFFLYLFAPVLWVADFNPVGIELALILLSPVTTFLFFKLGQEIKNNRLGYFLAILYAASNFTQKADRFIWVVGPIFFFTSGIFILALRAVRSKKITFINAFGIGAGISLAINFHYQAVALLLGFFPLLLYSEFRSKLSRKCIIGFILGLILFISPLIIFDLRHDFYNIRGALLLFTYSAEKIYLIDRIRGAVLVIANIGLAGIIPSGFLPPIIFGQATIVVIFIYGLFLSIIGYMQPKKKIFMIYVFWVLQSGILVFIALREQFGYYLYFSQVIFFILISLVLFKLWGKLILRGVITGGIVLFAIGNIYVSQRERQISSWPLQVQAVDYILQNRTRDKVEVFFQTFPSEEYAFLFYYRAKKLGIPYEKITFYEPWQSQNNAEFIVSPKVNRGAQINFGNLVIEKRG